jgi:hypothetical protein
MYVAVQRVVSPTSRETGINAFLYLHPGRKWRSPPADITSDSPGRLVRENVTVKPPGNRIRSNLEVVAPDDIELPEVRRHLMAFFDRAQFGKLPWEGVDGPCLFRLHMVPALLKAGWAGEAMALAAAGARLVEDFRDPPRVRSIASRR